MAEVPEELFLERGRGAGHGRPRLGADGDGERSTCGRWSSPPTRSCGVPAVAGVPLPAVRLARPARTSRRRAAGDASGCRPSTSAPRPAAPARRSARATTRRRLVAQAQAAEQGCDQVVWLDAVEHRYVEEMGGMNLFFVFHATTPARHAGADRHAAGRRHPRLDPGARHGPRLERRGAADLAPTSGSRAARTAASARCSPAARPRS